MITFIKSGRSNLNLERGQLFPMNNTIEPNQELHLTESDDPKVIDYGSSLKILELKFTGLSKDNYDGVVNGLKTWFESSEINWSENSFTLEDDQGNSKTVRFWDKNFNMPQIAANVYSLKIRLLEQ